jgi:predicted Holliday junction resolvase-like endonuclease
MMKYSKGDVIMLSVMMILYIGMMAVIIRLSTKYTHLQREVQEKEFHEQRELLQLEWQNGVMRHMIDSLNHQEEKIKIVTKNKIQYVKEIAIHDTMLLDSIAQSILLKLDSMDRARYFDSITNQ